MVKMSINPPQTFEETLDLFQPVPGSDAANTADNQALIETHDLMQTLPVGEESHFADDPEQTYLWTVGALSKEENDAVQSHLCHCKYCQMEVADMVESGAITLPTLQAERTVSPSSSRFTRLHRAILAVCAIGLFGVMLFPFLSGPVPVPVPLIATVDRDWLIPDTWVEAQTMSVGNQDKPDTPKMEKFDDSLYRNVPESEHSVVYHAAYGQYLLRHGKIGEAKEQFEAAFHLNVDSFEAALGLGRVAFAQEDYAAALDHFEKLSQRSDLSDTLQFIVAYNAARAARALEEWDIAKPYWKKAKELLKDEFASLSVEIEHELSL